MRIQWICVLLLTGVHLVSPLHAQQPKTGIVQVGIEQSMGMVSGLLVRSGTESTRSDAEGKARLVLPAGRHMLTVMGIGFKPTQAAVTVIADSVVTVTVRIEMAEVALQEVRISATRTERLAGETPVRVEVLDEMEVDENTLMAPSGITMLLNETPGLRVHAASPTLGTGSVRILGLPGQYTALLADGLPLYGGGASALGPLDISPVDLQRVEIIKGAASSLYGGQALGGVINFISKQPSGRSEVLLNRRTMGVTDAAAWLSHRRESGTGVSLLASGTDQSAHDVDSDGWADQPRAQRFGVRPRLTVFDTRGRSLFVTAGYGYDSRKGGTLGGALTPAGTTFREGLTSRRADVGATANVPLRDSGSVAFRLAVSTASRRREFGTGPLEEEHTATGFLELTRLITTSRSTTVIGSAVQLDDFENSLNEAYDHRWVTPSLFATTERNVGPVTLSASVRGDAHPEAGFQVTERLAALAKPVERWSVRLSAGTGFAAPGATIEETEAIGLRAVRPGAQLKRERSLGTMLDINGEVAGAELLVTAYGSYIRDAIQLADGADGNGEGILKNATETVRIAGVEGAMVWRFEGGRFLGTYGYTRGTRPDAVTGVREPIPLLPRHRVGGDLMLEKEKDYRVGVEGIFYGVQSLDDNPFRSESKPYVYVMAIAMKQFGGLEVVANFENLLNVRQTDTDPLVRPTPHTGGRWTTDVWAPLEGFMANVALRYRW